MTSTALTELVTPQSPSLRGIFFGLSNILIATHKQYCFPFLSGYFIFWMKYIWSRKKVKPDPKPEINLRMKKVLIIEDFFNFRLTVKNMVRSFGVLYIDDATTGEEGLRKMTVRKYDIILCDYNLGQGKSGQQVLEEAKFRNYVNYSTVYIMVTAENTMEMIMGAAEYQPDDYLMKPFAKEVLEKKIRNIMEKKENFKDIEKAMADNNYDQAISLCSELIAKAPRNLSDLLKFKGEILIKKGDYKEALDFYEKVLLMGNVIWADMGIGRVHLLTGNYEEARKIFERIIAKNDKIMTAYDYLSQALLKMDEPKEAQKVLMKATEISPRALLRQKSLGNIAYRNDDFTTAEQSFKAAVAQGKHSCLKSTSDYTSLAKTLVQRDASDEGLKVLESALQEFPENPDAKLQVSVTESYVYKKMNMEDEARKSMSEAEKLAENLTGQIPPEVELDLAKAYIMMGESDKGSQIIKRIVQGNYDDSDTLNIVKTVFKEAGMEAKGLEFITSAKDEIIKLNNEGVKLAQDGKLAEAIDYFEKAALSIPENKIINANAAQVLMLYMKDKGVNDQQMEKVKLYLDRVTKIDKNYVDLPMLISLYKELVPEE